MGVERKKEFCGKSGRIVESVARVSTGLWVRCRYYQLLRAIIFESGTATVCEGNFWLLTAGMIARIHDHGAFNCNTHFQLVSEPIEVPAVAVALRNFQFERDPFILCVL